MKRIVSSLIALSLSILLMSCENKTDNVENIQSQINNIDNTQAQTNTIEETNTKEYYAVNEQYKYNWKIGLSTKDEENHLGELLIQEDISVPLELTIACSIDTGETTSNDQIFNSQIQVLYDYTPIAFKMDNSQDFEYENYVELSNHTEYEWDIHFEPNQIKQDSDIHKLLVIVTTGVDKKAKDLGFSSDGYGISIIYDLVHTKDYNDNLNLNMSDYILNDSFIKVSEGVYSPRTLSLNKDENFNPNDEFIGIMRPNPSYTTNIDNINFNAFISNTKPNEDFLFLIFLNTKLHSMIYTPKFEEMGTYYTNLEIELPHDKTDYELTAHIIADPFEKINIPDNLFTKRAERFTITKE